MRKLLSAIAASAAIAVLLAGTSMMAAGRYDAAGRGGIRRPRRGHAPGRARRARTSTPHGADGSTAIMYAAANGDLELVRALIKAGANVKLKNQFGTSALTEAAIIGSAPIIDALLKAGADPNFKNSEWRNSADGRRAQRQGGRGQGPSGRGSRHQRQGNLGRTKRDHVGRRAKPGRHGEVPGVQGREPERSRQDQSVGAQDHPGTSPEGHEQGRLYPAALCRAGRLRGLRSEPAGRRMPIPIPKIRTARRRCFWRWRTCISIRPPCSLKAAPISTNGISSAARRSTWRPTSARCR